MITRKADSYRWVVWYTPEGSDLQQYMFTKRKDAENYCIYLANRDSIEKVNMVLQLHNLQFIRTRTILH